MKRIAWFDCDLRTGGRYAPFVSAQLGLNGRQSSTIKFLVDSGASLSLLPRSYISNLLAGQEAPAEIDIGLTDANGKPLRGSPFELDIRIVNTQLPTTRELFYVGRGFSFAVLGMTWFEKIGVHFQNFPHSPRGRRFALYPCPSEASASQGTAAREGPP